MAAVLTLKTETAVSDRKSYGIHGGTSNGNLECHDRGVGTGIHCPD